MRFLEYLFFKYYNWQIKVGNGDMSSFLSVLFISFSFTLYFVDIIMFYFFFLASNGDFLNNKYLFIIVFILFFFILYFLLVTNGKDIRIMEKYKKEWTGNKHLGAILFPFIAFIILNIEIFIKIKMNRGAL